MYSSPPKVESRAAHAPGKRPSRLPFCTAAPKKGTTLLCLWSSGVARAALLLFHSESFLCLHGFMSSLSDDWSCNPEWELLSSWPFCLSLSNVLVRDLNQLFCFLEQDQQTHSRKAGLNCDYSLRAKYLILEARRVWHLVVAPHPHYPPSNHGSLMTDPSLFASVW